MSLKENVYSLLNRKTGLKVNVYVYKGFLVIIFLLMFTECSKNIFQVVPGHWVSDIPFIINHVGLEVVHDNRIYESEHILTFSDASSDEYKIRFATYAERAFSELMQSFKISSARELGIVDQNTKLTVYTIKNLQTMQMAFPYGFLLFGEDSQNYMQWPLEMKYRFYREVKHEMMHVFQFLFGVLPNNEFPRHEPDKWFNEGIAEYVSGGFFIPIKTVEELQKWQKDPDHVNPISVDEWNVIPGGQSRVSEYYPVFGLAVRYLLSSRGMNKSLTDVKNMFLLLAKNKTDFASAFEQFMGLSLVEYRETFFERMELFLEK